MSDIPDKVITLYRTETLTLTLAETGVLKELDVEGYDKMTIYPEYTASTIGNTLITKLFFNNIKNDPTDAEANDGLLYHPEPDESVAAGVATVVAKTREYVALTAAAEAVPPISMPINDKKVKLFIAEIIPAGGHGTVTITVRLSRLGQ